MSNNSEININNAQNFTFSKEYDGAGGEANISESQINSSSNENNTASFQNSSNSAGFQNSSNSSNEIKNSQDNLDNIDVKTTTQNIGDKEILVQNTNLDLKERKNSNESLKEFLIKLEEKIDKLEKNYKHEENMSALWDKIDKSIKIQRENMERSLKLQQDNMQINIKILKESMNKIIDALLKKLNLFEKQEKKGE